MFVNIDPAFIITMHFPYFKMGRVHFGLEGLVVLDLDFSTIQEVVHLMHDWLFFPIITLLLMQKMCESKSQSHNCCVLCDTSLHNLAKSFDKMTMLMVVVVVNTLHCAASALCLLEVLFFKDYSLFWVLWLVGQ